ncbi:MAG: hypothetical protein JJV98_02125 [Desulfosarcina sp.]|nr:hypothetical protein [Desulfobacterales bacterium]
MSLRYKFNQARKLLAGLTPVEREKLARICEGIQRAQDELLRKAEPAMRQCLNNCEGLCCRNALVDDIIGLWDLVYILALTPALEETMAARVKYEIPFYTADCLFLGNDAGPCIFTSNVRPEVCITTFCSGDRGIQKEIRAVKRQFFKLTWFFMRRKPRAIRQALQRILKPGALNAADR